MKPTELLNFLTNSLTHGIIKIQIVPWFHDSISISALYAHLDILYLVSSLFLNASQEINECLGICPGNKMLFRQLMQLCFSLIISQVSVNLNLPLSTEKCTTFCIPPYNYWTQYKWKILWDETTMHWHKAINSLILLIVLLA